MIVDMNSLFIKQIMLVFFFYMAIVLANSINAQINVKKTNAGCTIDPFIDTFVLTY